MAWTTPRTWVTSEVDTAAFLNSHIRDNENALAAKCVVYRNLFGNNVVGVTAFARSFDGAITDPQSMWSAANASRVTVPIAGWYRCRGRMGGTSNVASSVALYKNGVSSAAGPSVTSNFVIGDYDIQCVAGDYIELVLTVGAGTLFVESIVGLIATDLSVEWIAP